MNRYGKLAKNSGIFAAANLGSHLITFLLVRFYTELLSSTEYGIIDFLVTTSSILIPFLSLAITEAVLRFSMDNTNTSDVFSNGLFVAVLGTALFAIVGPLFFKGTSYEPYFSYLVLMVFASSINLITAQFSRGIGKVTAYALAGIIKTATLVCGNLFFLLWMGWGIEGYLLAVILSELASAVYLGFHGHLFRHVRMRWNISLLKDMLRYSAPLMPNSLSWWVMNAADKYVILAVLGPAANGIYAVAHKIPSLINLCNSIFFQAWQLSAVQEASSETKAEFYSKVFQFLSAMLFVVASGLILLLQPVTKIMVAVSYGDVWKYTPFLIIAMVFSAFSSFLGTNYVAMKKTKGALITSLSGAAVNLVLNFCLVGRYGINGAAFSTMISFMVMWLFRAYDTRQFVSLRYDIVRLALSFSILLIQSIFIITDMSAWYLIACTVSMMILHFRQILLIAQTLWNTLKKKTRR